MPNKYTFEPPLETAAAEEFATKAKKTSQQNIYTTSEFSYQWQNQQTLTQFVQAQLTNLIGG
jgi:hypothetical protein